MRLSVLVVPSVWVVAIVHGLVRKPEEAKGLSATSIDLNDSVILLTSFALVRVRLSNGQVACGAQSTTSHVTWDKQTIAVIMSTIRDIVGRNDGSGLQHAEHTSHHSSVKR